jgi:hypothetical protein
MRSMVEGLRWLSLKGHQSHYTVQIRQDLARRNSDGSKSLVRKPFVASLIMDRRKPSIMDFAVYFDGKARLETSEIEDVRSRRMLAPELEAGGALAELAPEKNFGQGHVFAELSGLADRLAGAGQHGFLSGRCSPSTILRMVPLPVPGRTFRAAPAITS